MDDMTIIIVLAVILLLIVIGFGFLALLLRPLEGIRKALGSSAGLGKGGERTLQTILGPYIDANLVKSRTGRRPTKYLAGLSIGQYSTSWSASVQALANSELYLNSLWHEL